MTWTSSYDRTQARNRRPVRLPGGFTSSSEKRSPTARLIESLLIDDPRAAGGVLRGLIGVVLSMDDFGTGYSSLSYCRDR